MTSRIIRAPAGRRRSAMMALVLSVAVVASGCGLGAGDKQTGSASLSATRDFGAHSVASAKVDDLTESETVLQALEHSGMHVKTAYGGKFVTAIAGVAGDKQDSWVYYVNGIQASKGVAATPLHPGDHVWFDRHAWKAAPEIPAVVGSFPYPFRLAREGKRTPVTLSCAPHLDRACDRVSDALDGADVPVSRTVLGTGSGKETIRVLVAPLGPLAGDAAAGQLSGGPKRSGIFARPADGGRSLVLLDEDGKPARTLGAGAGLVAATRFEQQAPTWVVTGTDAAGVLAAAGAFNRRGLARHFALAVAPDGSQLALPRP